jgi:hypothetical protein
MKHSVPATVIAHGCYTVSPCVHCFKFGPKDGDDGCEGKAPRSTSGRAAPYVQPADRPLCNRMHCVRHNDTPHDECPFLTDPKPGEQDPTAFVCEKKKSSCYLGWIYKYVAVHPILRGGCAGATLEMIQEFPELKRVAGFANGAEHFWCVAPDETILDPTAGQFVGLTIEYRPFQPGDVVKVGRCMDCGDDIEVAVDRLDEPGASRSRVAIQTLARLSRKGLVIVGPGDLVSISLSGRAVLLGTPPDILRDMIGLVAEVRPTVEALTTLTRDQRELLRDWAAREHLAASDNNVRRRPRPAFFDTLLP